MTTYTTISIDKSSFAKGVANAKKYAGTYNPATKTWRVPSDYLEMAPASRYGWVEIAAEALAPVVAAAVLEADEEDGIDHADYWTARDAEMEQEEAFVAARPRTRNDAVTEMVALDCSDARESGTYNQARIDVLRAEIDAFDAVGRVALAASVGPEWPYETAVARRMAWNAAIAALPKGTTQAVLEARCGHTHAELRRALRLHQIIT